MKKFPKNRPNGGFWPENMFCVKNNGAFLCFWYDLYNFFQKKTFPKKIY